MYYFNKYSKESRNDWFEIADQEPRLDLNAYDEFNIERNNDFNLIIYKKYDENRYTPVAIFVSNGFFLKSKGLIKVLDANFGGLFIAPNNQDELWKIKDFLYKKIVQEYFSKEHRIDFIDFMYPAIGAIEKPETSFISNPTPYSYVNNNSIMYMELAGEYINKLKKTPRYEIKKGLKYLQKNDILKQKNKNIINHFIYLDRYKSQKLSINMFSYSYFEELLNSKFYNFIVCLDKASKKPISGVIYSVHGAMGNYVYNSSTDEGKNNFSNKALLYLAMEESKSAGAEYFILGNGFVQTGNMLSVTSFKRSMSSNEVACSLYRNPISLKGRIYASLLLLRGR
ncbi:hypothetical protein ABXT70_09985 [Candidatus Njordibacter sp. Uisw_039]|uniref:hypothetical protein n=1 Tax=Candidatus Njordibacter sp. Uisw_039 TaxID=3230972 RepID=UPI003D38B40F